MTQKILQYIEIDIDYCSLTYGVAPCEAEITTAPSDNTKILMHMNGDDATVTFTDENTAGSAHTWTAHGNAQIDTADSKFGGASAKFDGTGDYIDTPDHADFALGSGNWSIDFWFKFNLAGGTNLGLCGQADATPTAAGSSFFIQRDSANADKIQAVCFVGGVSSSVFSLSAYTLASNPGWHHLAFVRDSGNVRLFIDGVHQGATAISGTVNNSTAKFAIGALGDHVSTPMNGWIDEFRLSNLARWTGTSTFAVPTKPAGQTGTKKCFNTLVTCQDRPHFTNVPVTLRFAVPTNYLPNTIECIPNINNIQFDPAQISLGKDLGQRATLTITFEDHRHSDTGAGFDKYYSERTYNPYTQGTFWGKFRARQPFVRGRPLRWIVGDTGQALAAMETRHFIIDSFAGPDNNGKFKIIAKDMLKLADGDRALAPAVSSGYLVADITNVATSLVLTPTGSGIDYPTSGYVAIGGSEICAYIHPAPDGSDTDAFTKLLLHYDGPDGITGIIDSSPTNKGIATINNPSVVLDDAQSKFGGTSGLYSAGGRITFADSPDWDFGTGDFTIEWWERRTASGTGSPAIARDGSGTFQAFVAAYVSGANQVIFMSSNGTTWDIANALVIGAVDLNVWHHYAITRSGSTFRSFRDGTQTNTWSSAASLLASANPLMIGWWGTDNAFTGWMDELRISKGVARWTSNFTAPTAPYASGSTTASDTLTLLRGQLNTVAASHSAQDRVQWVLRYLSESPDLIIADLFETYAGVDPSFIPIDAWSDEISAHLNRLYSANIAQPTAVNILVSEIIEQAGLAMWWDDRNQQIGLQVLRGMVYNYLFNEDNVIADTIDVNDQPDKRLSQVHTYFGQINPLTSLTDKANYRSVSIITDAQSETDYGSPAIKEIFSRWIPALGRTIADRLGNILVSRFKDAPRKMKFNIMRNSVPELVLASGYQLKSWVLQEDTGEDATVNVQLTRLRPNPDVIEVEAEEVLVDVQEEDLINRHIIIDSNAYNVNLRSAHDQIFPAPESGITNVIVTINSGIKAGSTNNGLVALDIGSWPAGINIIVNVVGRIQGKGGTGGSAFTGDGETGGTALYTRYAIKLACSGQIYGGGGGGGWGSSGPGVTWGGGGGAGFDPGNGGLGIGGGFNGAQATTEAGGTGFGVGGAGGAPGTAGQNGILGPPSGNGGAAGNAIDGVSFVTTGTWDGTTFTAGALAGTVTGPQIN